MADMPNETWKAVGDRVRAARIAAGYKNRVELAADITLPRFGKDTLGDVERGTRQLFEHEAVELGRVLRRPPDSFYEEPDAGNDSQLDRLEKKLDGGLATQQNVRAQIEQQNQNLADQTEILKELKTLVSEIRSLVAVLQDAEVIERSAAAAVRSLPEWPAPPSELAAPPVPEEQRGTGTTGRNR